VVIEPSFETHPKSVWFFRLLRCFFFLVCCSTMRWLLRSVFLPSEAPMSGDSADQQAKAKKNIQHLVGRPLVPFFVEGVFMPCPRGAAPSPFAFHPV
jgi:hypothetical protein